MLHNIIRIIGGAYVMENYKNSYKVSQKELVSLSVYNVGYQKCTPGYEWGPGIRDHYLIHYIISGSGQYTVGHVTYELKAGDSFLVYPNTEISYRADTEDPWEYAWVGFAGSDASLILQATDFTRSSPCIFQVEKGDEIKRQLLNIYDARGSEFLHAVEMTGRLYTALSIYMQVSKNRPAASGSNSYVQKAIEYISSHYAYPITIEDIASYVGVSRSHLFRAFQTVLSQSPKEYLTDFRIRQSCYLLEHSNLSITAIANSLGFDNSLYFSKAFHKEKGMSPSEYRLQAKPTENA